MNAADRSNGRHHEAILLRLGVRGGRSRRNISQETGLSAATVCRAVRRLIRKRIVREIRESPRSVGRPTNILEINGEYGRIIGVGLLYPAARALVLNLRGEVLEEMIRPFDWREGRDGILHVLRDILRSALRRPRPGRGRSMAVGLAIPGQWDRRRGVSIQYPRVPDWNDVPLRDLVGRWTGLPVFLVGYAPAIALAEHARRGCDRVRGLLAVEAAENIAMGAVVNGEILEGASGNAGELGHITVNPRGLRCYCGNRGCLETVATCQAVTESARRLAGSRRPLTYRDMVRRAARGDARAAGVLRRAAEMLGLGVASAVNLFNPEVVVLSGRFFDAGSAVMEPLRRSIARRALKNTVASLVVEKSTLGSRAAALGAGIGAIREVLPNL